MLSGALKAGPRESESTFSMIDSSSFVREPSRFSGDLEDHAMEVIGTIIFYAMCEQTTHQVCYLILVVI